MVAELLAEEIQKASAVGRFLSPHAIEDCRRGWKVLAETFGEVRVDPIVFFFERDCQR